MNFLNNYVKLLAASVLLLAVLTVADESSSQTTCTQTADLIFLVDSSSSIWPPYFNRNTKNFIKAIIRHFNMGPGPSDSRVGLIQFSSRVYPEFYLKDYQSIEAIEDHINNKMRYRGGNTYTHLALNYATEKMLVPENGMRGNVSKLVIIITDGESAKSALTKKATDTLKTTRDVDVFSIGVGSGAKREELQYMASDPDSEFVFHVQNFDAIGRIESRFVNQTCKALKAAALSTTTPATITTPTTTTTTIPTTTTSPTTTTTTTATTTTTTTTTTPTPTTTTTTSTPTTTTTTATTTLTTPTTTPTTTTTTPTTPTTTPTTTTTTPTITTTTPATTTTTPTTTKTPTTTTTTPTTTTTTPKPTTPTLTTTTTTFRKPSPKPTSNPDEDRLQNDQPSPLQACRDKPADIYFLLDASSSVWIKHFHDRVLPFVRNLVSSFEISPMRTRVGLVTFSDDYEHVFNLAHHRNLKSLLKSLQPENVAYLTGGTNTGDAINFITTRAMANGAARQGVARIVITVTDGLSQEPKKKAQAAKRARSQGITLFSVGVGKYVDDKELASIASNPDEDFVFTVESFQDLPSITELLASKTCKAVTRLSSDEQYFGRSKIDCSTKPLNVMFMYEYMNSVQNAMKVLDHVIFDFASQAAIYAPRSRIGVMTQPCIGDDISMMAVHNFQSALVERTAKYYVTLADIVQKVRLDVFRTGGPIDEKKVAVIVIDSHLQDKEALRKEVRRLKFQDVHVMILAVGKVDERLLESIVSTPMKENVMRVDNYHDLESTELDLLHRMCSNNPGIFEGENMQDGYRLPRGELVFNANFN